MKGRGGGHCLPVATMPAATKARPWACFFMPVPAPSRCRSTLRWVGWLGQLFQLRQIRHGLRVAGTAHLSGGHQPAAHRWPIGLAKDAAPCVLVQLHTAHPRRLTVRHARDGRADGGGGAAGAAARAAVHGFAMVYIAASACLHWFLCQFEWISKARITVRRLPWPDGRETAPVPSWPTPPAPRTVRPRRPCPRGRRRPLACGTGTGLRQTSEPPARP